MHWFRVKGMWSALLFFFYSTYVRKVNVCLDQNSFSFAGILGEGWISHSTNWLLTFCDNAE